MTSAKTCLLVTAATLVGSVLLAQDNARPKYVTTGYFLSIDLQGAAPMRVDHTARAQRLQGAQFITYDSTFSVETTPGILIGLHGGWGINPWVTPFAGFSLGRGGRKAGGEHWWVNHGYVELGTRLNAALPQKIVVPYVTLAWGYRSMSHVRTTGETTTSGNVTYVYYDKEEAYSGTAVSTGIGLSIGRFDLSYTLSSGTPGPEEWELAGARNSRMISARIAVGISAYGATFRGR